MLAFWTGWRVAESSILPLSARDCPRADRQDPIAIQNMMISGLMALEIVGFAAKLEF
jgi:hypothetical protein